MACSVRFVVGKRRQLLRGHEHGRTNLSDDLSSLQVHLDDIVLHFNKLLHAEVLHEQRLENFFFLSHMGHEAFGELFERLSQMHAKADAFARRSALVDVKESLLDETKERRELIVLVTIADSRVVDRKSLSVANNQVRASDLTGS